MKFLILLLLAGPALAQDGSVFAMTKPADDVYQVLLQFYQYDRYIDLDARVIDEEKQREYFTREKIVMTAANGNRVPLYLGIPKIRKPPYPCILLLHDLSGSKDDWWERDSPYYGADLARKMLAAGYAVVTLDARFHGDRIAFNDFQPMDTTAMKKGHFQRYRETVVGTVVDYRRVIDYLKARREIDEERLGVVGYGMGGLMAIILTAVDERIDTVSACATPIYRQQLAAYAIHNYAHALGERPLQLLQAVDDPLYSQRDNEDFMKLIPASIHELKTYPSDHHLPNRYTSRVAAWQKEKLRKTDSDRGIRPSNID